jgi:hypothetical protein
MGGRNVKWRERERNHVHSSEAPTMRAALATNRPCRRELELRAPLVGELPDPDPVAVPVPVAFAVPDVFPVADEPPDEPEPELDDEGGAAAAMFFTSLHAAAAFWLSWPSVYGKNDTCPDEDSCTRAVSDAK